jgi:hypothetical protein
MKSPHERPPVQRLSNPSDLNAHYRVDDLAEVYGWLARSID